MSVASLVYKINADATSFGRELRFAERDVRRFQRRAESQILKVGKAFATMGGLVATGFVAMTRETIKYAAEMGAAADRTGMTTEELSRLQFAARESKVDVEAFERRMQRFNTEVAKSERGTTRLTEVFSDYGIAVRDADGAARSHTDILVDLADAVAGAEDSFAAAELSAAAFGSRGAAEMLPMLRQGGDAIEDLTDRADELGVTLDQGLADAADMTERRFRELRDITRSFALDVGNNTIPIISEYASHLVRVAQNKNQAGQSAGFLSTALRGVLLSAETARIGFMVLGESIGFVLAKAALGFEELQEEAGEEGWGKTIFRRGYVDQHPLVVGWRAVTGLVGDEQEDINEETDRFTDQQEALAQAFKDRLDEIYKEGAEGIAAILEDPPDISDLMPDTEDADVELIDFDVETNEADRKLRELEQIAGRWIERTRTNVEAFEHEIQKVDAAFEAGFLSYEQWLAAEQMLGEQFDPEGLHAWNQRMLEMADFADQVRAEINGVDLALEAHLESLAELHDEGFLTWEEYRLAVEMAKGETEELANATSKVQDEAASLFDFVESGSEVLADQLIDAIVDPFNVSLEDMAANFSRTLTRMALELAAQQALLAVFGGGAGGVGGALAFASGGYVSGPGGPTSDSIPAYLSDGEYVLRANATQSIGPSTLDFMNRTGKIPGYAAGGLVGGGSAGDHGTTPNIKILNVAGQSPEDFMRSKAGERLIVNHMMKNADRMRQ